MACFLAIDALPPGQGCGAASQLCPPYPGSDPFLILDPGCKPFFSSRILHEKWNAKLLFLASYAFRRKVFSLSLSKKKFISDSDLGSATLSPSLRYDVAFQMCCHVTVEMYWLIAKV
jgi:hypothetical protein